MERPASFLKTEDFDMDKKLTALLIMDGFAWTEDTAKSAIEASGYPNLKRYLAAYPHATLGASGRSVGLPDGQMGNSEVGHLNIGAGRIVYQELTRITKEIEDGTFFANAPLIAAMDGAKKNGKKLHCYGLLSSGGVHSHNTHLYALLKMAKERGVPEVVVHCFLDGRDVSPTSGAGFVRELQEKIAEIGCGVIGSVMGRYYAMDRDNRWDRVEKAYRCMTECAGKQADDAAAAVEASYAAGVTDEFVEPTVIATAGKTYPIEEGDSVIFFNFRPDRAREITRALTQPGFDGFPVRDLHLNYVCFTQYDATFRGVAIAFPPQRLDNTLGEYLAACGKTQVRIAETEKYAHVTFFFNGGVEKANPGEDRILVPSPKVATYDLKPEMSAFEVCDKALEAMDSGKYDVMILNFANCDMVGHTGVFEAAKKAVDTVDACMGKLLDRIVAEGGTAIVTADHGNADCMVAEDGSPFTAHTTNPVPVLLVSEAHKGDQLRKDGILADLAPTLLTCMGLKIPPEMTGKSLIVPEK